MNKFIPHKDYDMLRKQAYALAARVINMQTEIQILRTRAYDTREEVIRDLKASIESERDMNDILTKEIEDLKMNPSEKIIKEILELSESLTPSQTNMLMIVTGHITTENGVNLEEALRTRSLSDLKHHLRQVTRSVVENL